MYRQDNVQLLVFTGGVTLKLQGVILPNNSLVDIDDIMYTSPDPCCRDLPSNTNPRDEALKCVTDLRDCCVAPARGYWYFPDGSRVGYDAGNSAAFQANRGQNEKPPGHKQTIYGSVRLYRRYSPMERGRFRCELPSQAAPSVNQIYYVNICESLI